MTDSSIRYCEKMSTVGSAVQLLLAGPADLEQIAELLPELAGPLFPERFPNRTAVDFCRWKYFGNPTGNAIVGIAIDSHAVVSLAAGTPKLVQVGSERFLAFELGDFITAVPYRRLGLFSNLIGLICEEARKLGAEFVYVHPNSSSLPILTTHLAFNEICLVEEHRLALPSGVLERRTGIPAAISSAVGLDWITRNVVLPPVSPDIEVRQLSRFGEEFSAWGERVTSEYKFALVRNRNYLNWRYADGPAPYRTWAAYRGASLSGFITTFVFAGRPTGFILDLMTEPGDTETAGSLLRVAIEEMLRAGANEIYASTASQILACDVTGPIRKACPLRGGAFRPFVARWLGKPQPFPAEGWHLVMGDFDGI